MSIFKVPRKVLNEINTIQRKFLWGWGHDGKKIAWVSWKTVCKSKDMGGPGIKELFDFNKALLDKWK